MALTLKDDKAAFTAIAIHEIWAENTISQPIFYFCQQILSLAPSKNRSLRAHQSHPLERAIKLDIFLRKSFFTLPDKWRRHLQALCLSASFPIFSFYLTKCILSKKYISKSWCFEHSSKKMRIDIFGGYSYSKNEQQFHHRGGGFSYAQPRCFFRFFICKKTFARSPFFFPKTIGQRLAHE